MTNEERARQLLKDVDRVCNEYASTEQDDKLEALFLTTLADARRAALEELIRVGEREAYSLRVQHSGDQQLAARMILEAQREYIVRHDDGRKRGRNE